jgi:general secretion pathway protein H
MVRMQRAIERAGGGRAARRAGQRGLTLIEMLIVLLIVGLIMWSASMSMGAASQAEVVRSTNQLASMIRFAYDRARFTGQHYRIHIDFDERSFQLQRADEAMYLPATGRDGKIFVRDAKDADRRAQRDQEAAESYYSTLAAAVYGAAGDPDAPADPYAVQKRDVPRQRPPLFEVFEDDQTLGDLGKPIKFPDGVEVLSVQTDADIKPITEGEADLYFFPRGQTQLAAIQLKGRPKLGDRMLGEEDIEYTILVQPLTGKVTVESGIIDLKLPKVVGDSEDDLGEKTDRRSF